MLAQLPTWIPSLTKSEFLASLRFSLSFLSSLTATASAALPLGQRMIGIVPKVTQTAKRESTICKKGGIARVYI